MDDKNAEGARRAHNLNKGAMIRKRLSSWHISLRAPRSSLPAPCPRDPPIQALFLAQMPASKQLRGLAILATASIVSGNHYGETCNPACTAPQFCHGWSVAGLSGTPKCER